MLIQFENGEFDLQDGDMVWITIKQDKKHRFAEIVKCVECGVELCYNKFGEETNYKFNSKLDIFVKKIKLLNK